MYIEQLEVIDSSLHEGPRYSTVIVERKKHAGSIVHLRRILPHDLCVYWAHAPSVLNPPCVGIAT